MLNVDTHLSILLTLKMCELAVRTVYEILQNTSIAGVRLLKNKTTTPMMLRFLALCKRHQIAPCQTVAFWVSLAAER